MAAPFLQKKVMEFEDEQKAQQGKIRDLPWARVNTTISIPRFPAEPDADELERRKQKRDTLAAQAAQRYEEWKSENQQDIVQSSKDIMKMSLLHPNDIQFRDRNKAAEHAGEWASADKVLHERDRIQRAQAAAEAAYLQHPPYPKSGGGVKNVDFSYMKSGYDYRLREPSKEVAGTWPIMRVRPLTESARINEAAAQSRPCDTLGGGRWTLDYRYGNPPAFSPTTTGDNFRQSHPRKWLHTKTPPATAPPPAIRGRLSASEREWGQHSRPGKAKWRGGFVTDFPPRSAVPAQPFVGDMPWLHHTEEYVDHFHDQVAINVNHLPATQRSAFRPIRKKSKELTGGDGRQQFWPQSPVNVYVPNPLLSCTWNQTKPSSPLPVRAYLKSGRSDGTAEGHGLASGSGVREEPSGVGTSFSG